MSPQHERDVAERVMRSSLGRAIAGNAIAALFASGVGGGVAYKLIDYRQTKLEEANRTHDDAIQAVQHEQAEQRSRIVVLDAGMARVNTEISVQLRDLQSKVERIIGKLDEQDRHVKPGS